MLGRLVKCRHAYLLSVRPALSRITRGSDMDVMMLRFGHEAVSICGDFRMDAIERIYSSKGRSG